MSNPQCATETLRKTRNYVRAVFDLVNEFRDQPYLLQEIDTVLAQSDAEPTPDDNFERHQNARISKLEREIYTLRANLVECADTLSAQHFNQAQQKRIEACRVELAALTQSDAERAKENHMDCYQYGKVDAQSDVEPGHDVQVTDKMVDTAQRSLYGDFSVADVNVVRRALEAALAQSDAEPVAWRVRDFADGWVLCHSREQAIMEAESGGNRIEALYTIPPRSAQSDAGPDASPIMQSAAEVPLWKRQAQADASAAEIVQWQRRRADDDGWASSWYDCRDDEHLTPKEAGKRDRDGVGYHWEYRPLYASPPTSAGLIEAAVTEDDVDFCFEAAEIAERNGADLGGYIRAALEKFVELRSRATNRSGKCDVLIEAADLFDKLRIRHLLDEWFAGPNPTNVDALANVLRLRLARAADRSGK